MTNTYRIVLLLTAMLFCVFLTLQIGHSLSVSEQWAIVHRFSFEMNLHDSFAAIVYAQSQLPRIVMAVLVGGTLGLVGSVLQQLTQNNLLSPLTLGTSSGAWLAMVIGSVWFPVVMADYASLVALLGAILTLLVVILIVGLKNMSGLPIILAGMAINILFGAVATAIVLLNEQYVKSLFIWGAGDLAQNGWGNLGWLIPKLTPIVLLLAFAPRVLAILRLGQTGAQARGLNIMPAFCSLLFICLWLVSVSISSVGVISFIGLLSPNIARGLGARTPRAELISSLLLGAILLLVADMIALFVSEMSFEMVPSGTAAALIGAPALILFTRRQLTAKDNLSLSLPHTQQVINKWQIMKLLIMLVGTLLIAVFLSRTTMEGAVSWIWQIPDHFAWQLQWPRLLTAISVGAGLAVAGVILQRLIYNPLASPDILGLSAGATFTLVAAGVFLGVNVFKSGPGLAFAGSMTVLLLLLILGKRNQYAPSMMILTGIALTALIDALVSFSLIKGNEDTYAILTWLVGSTYRATPGLSLILALVVGVLAAFTLLTSRWLTILSSGRAFAKSRGLNVSVTFAILFIVVGLLCAVTTTAMGPVAFVGLLAPHMAILSGAKKAKNQLWIAMLFGVILMVLADWLGQNIRYPVQIAAGTVVSVIGGSYFLVLLIKSRKSLI